MDEYNGLVYADATVQRQMILYRRKELMYHRSLCFPLLGIIENNTKQNQEGVDPRFRDRGAEQGIDHKKYAS